MSQAMANVPATRTTIAIRELPSCRTTAMACGTPVIPWPHPTTRLSRTIRPCGAYRTPCVGISPMAERKRPRTDTIGNDSPLTVLGRELRRSRSRASRLWRSYQTADEDAAITRAHQAWSDAVDDALQIAEAISLHQAHDLGALTIQFEAMWWWIVEDDSILDASARRWLRRFRRSLRLLEAES